MTRPFTAHLKRVQNLFITSLTLFKSQTKQHILPYPKDTASKYLIIKTETYKIILPGW